jgi:hypothetical protein
MVDVDTVSCFTCLSSYRHCELQLCTPAVQNLCTYSLSFYTSLKCHMLAHNVNVSDLFGQGVLFYFHEILIVTPLQSWTMVFDVISYWCIYIHIYIYKCIYIYIHKPITDIYIYIIGYVTLLVCVYIYTSITDIYF